MNKKIQRTFSFFLAIIFLFGMTIHVGLRQTVADEMPSQPMNPVYDASTDTTDWSYVYFGSYPQTMLTEDELTEEIINADYDKNGDAEVNGAKYRKMKKNNAVYSSMTTAEGFFDWSHAKKEIYFRYEPIRWRVLQNDGESLFLLADSILDCQLYERTDGKITWENCTMRNWLNAYYPFNAGGFNFLKIAFSKEEEDAILTTTVNNPNNPFHGTKGGNTTQDKLFLLSIPEVTNETYGFAPDYKTYSATRRLGASDYARARGLWMGSHNDLFDGNAIWLLRSPGSYQQTAALVYRFGYVYQDGYYANTPYYGVAPALKVSLSSNLWKTQEEGSRSNTSSTFFLSQNTIESSYDLSDAHTALLIALQITKGTDEDNYIYDIDDNEKITLKDTSVILEAALGITKLDRKIFQQPPASAPAAPTEKPIITPPPPAKTTPVPTEEPPLVQTQHDASGTIWLAADSIAAYHSKNGYSQPLYGWGELIGNYFKDSVTANFEKGVDAAQEEKARSEGAQVFINNTALSSRSTKSFTKEPNYTSMMQQMSEGDYLLISFGHNDERACVDLYTDPFAGSSDERSFKWYLKTYYINPAIREGAQPVLISPVVRRYFYQGEFVNPQLHTPYADAMKELSEEYAQKGITVYYIDLHHPMLNLYEQLGEQGTAALHGKNGNLYDHTHLSYEGACWVCEQIVEQIKEQNMNLSTLLK